jgi:hypothetical protein
VDGEPTKRSEHEFLNMIHSLGIFQVSISITEGTHGVQALRARDIDHCDFQKDFFLFVGTEPEWHQLLLDLRCCSWSGPWTLRLHSLLLHVRTADLIQCCLKRDSGTCNISNN